MKRSSLWVGLCALCALAAGCADEAVDDGAVGDELAGDPNASLDDQLARIAEDEAAHGALPSKADGVLPGFEDAADVNKAVITIAADVPVPSYQRAQGANGFGLGGTEFWQKWAGGHNPTYSYAEGTDAGRKCMQASAIRFDALMADPPATYVHALNSTNWSGRHFNWNDDYSHEDARGSASGATLWAWRTGLMKFISQTGDGGKCYLPTRVQLEAAGVVCALKAQGNEGETQGCSVRAYEVDRVLERYADYIAELNAPSETPEADPNATRYEGPADLEIPDADPEGLSTSITVDATGSAARVFIEVDIEHTYISDLTVTLSHAGVSQVLHQETGRPGEALSIRVDSEKFFETDKAGEWTLKVIDNAAQDTGVLKAFAISL
jgi:hypothetical protein